MWKNFLLKYPFFVKLFVNNYAPYLGAGVKATTFDPEHGKTVVEMPLTRSNQNVVGTHFGGSLYAMVDPFYMLMLMNRLGPDYVVWDKAAAIDFVSPGRGTVYAEMEIPDDEVEEIKKLAADGKPVYRTYHAEIRDRADNKLVAKAEKILYIRKRQDAGSSSPS